MDGEWPSAYKSVEQVARKQIDHYTHPISNAHGSAIAADSRVQIVTPSKRTKTLNLHNNNSELSMGGETATRLIYQYF